MNLLSAYFTYFSFLYIVILLITRRTALSIPLDKLIDKEGNIYEMTCVAIKEANILSSTSAKDEIEAKGEKIVSHVLTQVLDDEIAYTTDEKK